VTYDKHGTELKVGDEVELTHFGEPHTMKITAVHFPVPENPNYCLVEGTLQSTITVPPGATKLIPKHPAKKGSR
jgi:hypothetical protein